MVRQIKFIKVTSFPTTSDDKLPFVNELHDPTKFTVDRQGQRMQNHRKAFRSIRMRLHGVELLHQID